MDTYFPIVFLEIASKGRGWRGKFPALTIHFQRQTNVNDEEEVMTHLAALQ